ncbi:MAG: hypothetical protein AAF677_03630 [Pseudomonadota bacterium]
MALDLAGAALLIGAAPPTQAAPSQAGQDRPGVAAVDTRHAAVAAPRRGVEAPGCARHGRGGNVTKMPVGDGRATAHRSPRVLGRGCQGTSLGSALVAGADRRFGFDAGLRVRLQGSDPCCRVGGPVAAPLLADWRAPETKPPSGPQVCIEYAYTYRFAFFVV